MYPHSQFIGLANCIALAVHITCYFHRPTRPVLLITAPPLPWQFPTMNYGVWDDMLFRVSFFIIFIFIDFLISEHIFWWDSSVIKYGIIVRFTRMNNVCANIP